MFIPDKRHQAAGTMSKPHLLQVGTLPESETGPLAQDFTVHRLFDPSDRAAFPAGAGPLIQAIATRGDLGASSELIAACPHLQIISVFGVGFDAVDLAACRQRGIRVANTPDVLTEDCADLAIGMMLAQSRGIVAADRFARDGSWVKGGFPLQRRVWGRRAGILGLGRIGAAVARRLDGFGMDIAWSARSAKPVPSHWAFVPDPAALAQRSDLLVVTLAASAETRHIVNAEVLSALGPDGMLINISRAANIDEGSLLDALEQGRLGSAALDVFEGEPNLNPRFLALPNVLLQPHHASGTVETRKAMGQRMRDNLAAHFSGRPLPGAVI
jgi:lactate dehydrogenase-like 2-hydroxyacid dehydrogenase